MWDKIVELLKMPGYIETRTITIDISKEDILQLVREGKIWIRKDGKVEIIDKKPVKNITTETKLLEE